MTKSDMRVKFKNMKHSPSLVQYAEKKLVRLNGTVKELSEVKCTLSIDKYRHIVHVSLSGSYGHILGEAESKDMYQSIDMAAKKIESQLMKLKDKKVNHKYEHLTKEGKMRTEACKLKKAQDLKVMPTLVKDLMTSKPFTLFEDDNLQFAEDLMQWRYIRHIPVINDLGKLVGLITHRDLLKASLSAFDTLSKREKKEFNLSIAVQDVMQRNILSVGPNASIHEAAKYLLDNKFGCLPVVKGQKLIGILTEADFVKYVDAWLE